MAKKGIEWVNKYHGRASNLSYCDDDARGFYNTLSGIKKFDYGNDSAWDKDFEHSGVGSPSAGTDSSYADNVDIIFYAGHSSRSGLFFGKSNKDNGLAAPSELKLGDKSLEWLVLSSCEFLHRTNVFDRLRDAFDGLHYILGFHTVCSDTKDRGEKFASKLNDGQRIRSAWIKACAETENSSKECAYLRADDADSNTYYDHWHGKGSVSSDPRGSKTFFYFKTTC